MNSDSAADTGKSFHVQNCTALGVCSDQICSPVVIDIGSPMARP